MWLVVYEVYASLKKLGWNISFDNSFINPIPQHREEEKQIFSGYKKTRPLDRLVDSKICALTLPTPFLVYPWEGRKRLLRLHLKIIMNLCSSFHLETYRHMAWEKGGTIAWRQPRHPHQVPRPLNSHRRTAEYARALRSGSGVTRMDLKWTHGRDGVWVVNGQWVNRDPDVSADDSLERGENSRHLDGALLKF